MLQTWDSFFKTNGVKAFGLSGAAAEAGDSGLGGWVSKKTSIENMCYAEGYYSTSVQRSVKGVLSFLGVGGKYFLGWIFSREG